MKLSDTLFLALLMFLAADFCTAADWTVYNTTNSGIPFDKPYALAIDTLGRVWCGNDNSGSFDHLSCYDGTNWYGFVSDAWVNSICVGPDNAVWVETSNRKIQYFDGVFLKVFSCPDLKNPWSFPLYVDKQKRVWLFSNKALLHHNGSSWVKFDSVNSPVKNCTITEIVENGEGVWFSTWGQGLLIYGPEGWNSVNKSTSGLPNDTITGMVAKDGNLWVSTKGKYLCSRESAQWQSETVETEAASISLCDIDAYGSFWFLTNAGALEYDGTKTTIYNTSNSPLATNQLLTLKADKSGNVWIGSWGSGLYKYSRQSNGVRELTELSKPRCVVEPNPVNGSSLLQFVLKTQGSFTITLYDVNGCPAASYDGVSSSAGMQEYRINTSGLASGIYMIDIRSGRESCTGKLVIED